jgi:hypothetical protein
MIVTALLVSGWNFGRRMIWCVACSSVVCIISIEIGKGCIK